MENGFIERSNRTDDDNFKIRFTDSQDCKYQLKLCEIEYNRRGNHQGIHNLTPLPKAQSQYPTQVNFAIGVTQQTNPPNL